MRTIVVAFGNVDRADDGVALHIVNEMRARLGQGPLSTDVTGLEQLGADIDSVFLSQLVPELVDILPGYAQVAFVDAHAQPENPDLYCVDVASEYAPSTFTHHMTPAMLLALADLLHHSRPRARLVSIRGYDFDFHTGLSEATAAQVGKAVDCLLEWIRSAEASATA